MEKHNRTEIVAVSLIATNFTFKAKESRRWRIRHVEADIVSGAINEVFFVSLFIGSTASNPIFRCESLPHRVAPDFFTAFPGNVAVDPQPTQIDPVSGDLEFINQTGHVRINIPDLWIEGDATLQLSVSGASTIPNAIVVIERE